MKIFVLFLIFLNECLAQTTFSNPNYPKLIDNLPSYSQTYGVSAGKSSVALLFRQFELEAADCIIIQQGNSPTGKLNSLCGNAFGDPLKPKALVMSSYSARVATFSGNKTDDMQHAGVLADVVNLDDSMSYFTCGSRIDLSTLPDSHFILASQNYPEEPTAYAGGCTITFVNKDSIRFAIYSLVVDSVRDNFSITGNGQTETFSGFNTTNTLSTVRYYSTEVTAKFSYATENINYQRGFYILVNGYKDTPKVNGDCAGAVKPVTILANDSNALYYIGQQPYLNGKPYDNNEYCDIDYTKTEKEHWFYVDLSFSTEACCDYMDTTGLLTNPKRLQGFIGHNFYFSKADRITMNFMADAVGQGAGFFGSISTLDCTQCGGVLTFGVNMNKGSVMSPNYVQSSQSYCPNLNCKWTINIDYGYYVNFVYRGVTLSQPDKDVDYVIIKDQFGSVIRNYVSGGPVDLTESNVITGPITVEFKSSNQTQFAFDKIGKGFNIDMYSYKQQYISQNVTLTDSQYFVDISQNNFNVVAVTYSYLVQARPGKKISLYFMTSIENQAFVTIYDGANTNAAMIYTSLIVSTNFNNYVVKAPRVTSTGQFMLIHIRPGTDREPGRYTQDFQAIVTDYEPPAGCGYLVQSINPQRGSVNAVQFNITKGENCQMIVRATDPTNAALLAAKFQYIEVTGLLSLYKGLITDDKHLLKSDVDSLLVFDRNTVIQYTAPVAFVYNWGHAAQYDKQLLINGNDVGVFMTQDYLPDEQKMTNNTQQSFIIKPNGNRASVTLTILKPIGAGKVQIQIPSDSGTDQTYTYDANNIGDRLAFNCKYLTLNYSSPIGQNNGLYATYEATFNPPSKSASFYSMFTMLCLMIARLL